ncbi:growth hormone secretagogue receptor type 1-like [Mercenaria mercenaria]|uniref:growth hormone secretagogue receptor type 1-like n=1 Tax=Mercenaria mercenaria TaxID=6596 RepID=UPI00234EDC2E|nr:growth hormone secretagogue receptor type 1-like [Mercenaria mercenaria]
MVCRNPIRLYWQRVYITGLTALFYMVPCVILLAIYVEICRELVRSNMDQGARFGQSEVGRIAFYSERKRSQRQVLNLISSIVFVFFLCHLPLRVAGLWFTFEDKNVIYSLGLEKYLTILYATRIIFYLNHALNPIVYNFVSRKFRQALKSVSLKKWSRSDFKRSVTKRMIVKSSSNRKP